MTLGEAIAHYREAQKMSQPELAEASGIPVGTIRGIEQGRRVDPQWSNIRDICDALGITCHDLVMKTKSKKS